MLRYTSTGITEGEIINIAKEWETDLIVMVRIFAALLDAYLMDLRKKYVISQTAVLRLATPPRME